MWPMMAHRLVRVCVRACACVFVCVCGWACVSVDVLCVMAQAQHTRQTDEMLSNVVLKESEKLNDVRCVLLQAGGAPNAVNWQFVFAVTQRQPFGSCESSAPSLCCWLPAPYARIPHSPERRQRIASLLLLLLQLLQLLLLWGWVALARWLVVTLDSW
jgi:hypothetical protein